QHLLDRYPAGKRVGVAPIGAEAKIARPHGGRKAGRDRFLAEREMARALDQVLQEQIERALLSLADLDLHAIPAQPHLLADLRVQLRLLALGGRRPALLLEHDLDLERTTRRGPAGLRRRGGTIPTRHGVRPAP